MAYIKAAELSGRLPLDGQGLTDREVQEAIDAAIEEVAGITGDKTGASANLRLAVIEQAMADLFDTKIFPQDARRPGTESSALRSSVTRRLDAWRAIQSDDNNDGREDPPSGYISRLVY